MCGLGKSFYGMNMKPNVECNIIFGDTRLWNLRSPFYPTKRGHLFHFTALQNTAPLRCFVLLSNPSAIDLYSARSWQPCRLRAIAATFILSGGGISILPAAWRPRKGAQSETQYWRFWWDLGDLQFSTRVTRIQVLSLTQFLSVYWENFQAINRPIYGALAAFLRKCIRWVM